MNYFNINSVRNISSTQSQIRKNSFVTIENQIQQLIMNRASHGFFDLYFTIPSFILGQPPFNLNECTNYMYHTFIQKGFEVNIIQNIESVILHVCWKNIQNDVKNADKTIIQPQNYAPKTKRGKKVEIPQHATMTMFHKSGFVDNIPVNVKNTTTSTSSNKSLYL